MISGDAEGAADLMRRHVVEAYLRVRLDPEPAQPQHP